MLKFILPSLLLSLPVHSANAFELISADTIVRPKPTTDSAAPSKKLYWLTFGGGVIGPGLGGDFKATYAWGEASLSAKICGASQFTIFLPPDNEIIEYGIYYGLVRYNDWVLARVAAGPSYFTGVQNHRTESIHNFGIGAEFEAMIKFQYVGLSLMATSMLGPKFFYGGVVVNFSFGKLN